jgi:hypothetical protein
MYIKIALRLVNGKMLQVLEATHKKIESAIVGYRQTTVKRKVPPLYITEHQNHFQSATK